MSFEAVPCMFRSTATDGNSSSYIGLLIRPSSSASAPQATNPLPLPTVVGTSSNGPKSLHVVPSTVLKANHPSNQTAKVVVPSGVQLRLQPAPCNAPQCNDAWIQTTQTAPRSNMSSTFDSPSPSQVVPQMNVGDTYDCGMPSVSSNSFFPPISSITQNLSSAKSDIDLLQEMSPLEMNPMQSQKMPIASVDYPQHVTPPHPYHTPAPCNYSHIPVDLNAGRMPSCRYQSGYNGVSDCSATPDSGIQSIAGSPPSTGPFTPPMPSPAPYISMVSTDNELLDRPSTSCGDFSDMPRLVPFHQMEDDADSPAEDEAPLMVQAVKPESCDRPAREERNDVPKIAITPAMNVSDLVEQIMSQMDAEQRKQFATVIQSKVVDTGSEGTDARVANPETCKKRKDTASNVAGDCEGKILEKMRATDAPKRRSDLQRKAGKKDGEGSLKRRSKKNDETGKKRLLLESEKKEEPKRALEESLIPLMLNDNQEDQLATTVSEEEKNKQIRAEAEAADEENRRRREREEKERAEEKEKDIKMMKEKAEEIERRKTEEKERELRRAEERERKKMEEIERERQRMEERERKRAEEKEKEREMKRAEEREKKFAEEREKEREKEKEREREQEREKKLAEEREKEEELLKKKAEEEAKLAEEKLAAEEREKKEMMCKHIREHRLHVKNHINKQLDAVLENSRRSLASWELHLGEPMHREMPWYRLNWKDVAQRVVERNRMEKLAKEKNMKFKSKVANRKKSGKRKLPDEVHSSDMSVAPSSSRLNSKDNVCTKENFSEIKQNVIVDVYPRVDQMSCSCKSGRCGEEDKCLNRIMQMECSNSCPRSAQCTNRRIFRRECVSRLETFKTSNGCGLGVKCLDEIEKGQFICEYVGEVISKERFESRSRKNDRNFDNHYALNLCPGFVIDASRKGSIARYVNHSCSPNCEMQRWCVNGQNRIGLFALRAITNGEELTYDYNWDAFAYDDMTTCLCGSNSCRRFINKNVLMSPRERQLAQNNRLLLLRNVDKAANRRIANSLRATTKQVENTAKKSSVAVYQSALSVFADEAISALGESEAMSLKQLKCARQSVSTTLSASPALTFGAAVDAIESQIAAALDSLSSRVEPKKLDSLTSNLLSLRLKHADVLRQFGTLPDSFEDRRSPKSRKRPVAHRILPAIADLSYLESEVSVGSYDPDNISHLSVIEAESDCVRCICGITDDDGSMVQCDSCHFWLHEDCVYAVLPINGSSEFQCEICKRQLSKRTPSVDIPLRVQPDIKLEGCTYYRTLVNSNHLQVRVYETVYVLKLVNDEHKTELKRLNEAPKSSKSSTEESGESSTGVGPPVVMREEEQIFVKNTFHRKNLRCFRVERLFISPRNHKFVFGFYYARPHEVYCEPGRMFHRNELFSTPMFDTLPLEAVVGRCLVLEPRVYALGRPKMPRYDEADVYFCEYQQTGRNSRYFEKIPSRNHYYINTEPHNFDRFPKERPVTRSFSPFIMESQGGSSRHNSVSHGRSGSSNRALSKQRPRSVSAMFLRDVQKVERLEQLVQALPSKKTAKSNSVASRSSSPPQKRSRQTRR